MPFNPTRKYNLDTKLVRYALAGGALLGLPAAADASVIFTPASSTVSPGQIINFNFDPAVDSTTDFTLTNGTSFIDRIDVTGPVTTFFDIGPLNSGDPITIANTTSGGTNALMKKQSGPTYNYAWGGVVNGSTHYLGVRFQQSGADHLGWVALSMQKDIPNVTVLGYAYESDPRTEISAGAAPEPSSIALFAAGAAGIMALRRRRRKA
jgi:hypothetical protein